MRASTSWRFQASAKSCKTPTATCSITSDMIRTSVALSSTCGDCMKKKTSSSSSKGESPSSLIDGRIQELDDWRGDMLSRLRAVIKQAAPAVVEEWKWRGVPVWYQNGMICTGETYKGVVKVTFFKGAQMKDPKNSSTRASKATPGVRSTFTRATRSTSRVQGTDPRSCHSEHSVRPPLKAGGRDVPFACQPSAMALRIRII